MTEYKKHLDIEKQVELLRSRGLIIDNEQFAQGVLSSINYYRLTGYLHDFRKPQSDEYEDGLTFRTIYALYNFDRRLTRILMYALDDIERTLKTRISYTITSEFPDDPFIYSNNKIYQSGPRANNSYEEFKKDLAEIVKRNHHLPFVKHHIEKYDGRLPMWVMVELFTMGNLNTYFHLLKNVYRSKIAKQYNTNRDILTSWIQNLTYTRNHLAHYMRIYNFNFGRSPAKCKNHSAYMDSSNKIFDQIYIMSCMYSSAQEWDEYILPELQSLLREFSPVISLSDIGFPDNWVPLLLHQ